MENIKEVFKMNRVDMIRTEISKKGFKVGCINRNLDKLTKVAYDKVVQAREEEHADVFVTIRNKLYVVEIATVDDEKDVNIMSGAEYFATYGNLDDCFDNGDITEEQYKMYGGRL